MNFKELFFIEKLAVICFFLLLIGAIVLGVLYVREERSYDKISYTVNDTLPDGEGKSAKVILLGGQSNASGCSKDEYLKENVSAEKYEEYQNGYDNVYINYFASSSNESRGFVKSGSKQGEAGGYFGPELGLAETLNELYPDETFFIIKWAWGGTNLFEQWLSPSSKGKTGDLYKHFVKYVEASMEYLVSKNYDVKIEGMCWMQGESDSFTEENATDYELNLNNFIADIRERFEAYASDDGIAFVDAYIAAAPTIWVHYDLVNESKQKVADSSEINVVIDTVAEGLTRENEPAGSPDLAHYDSTSEVKLGNLFGEAVAKFFDKD